MSDKVFYCNLDYDLYYKISTKIISNLKFLDKDMYDFYISTYLELLYDFKIINENMYVYCHLQIMEDLKKYEK